MSATDFEYAIKKDVRNNPIIREVDRTRQRQLVRSTACWWRSCCSRSCSTSSSSGTAT
jgi:hypothetical protein